ncbi:hypothetical protein VSWAT3_19711 [Vibrionales bacterium SWAT-3]|nr:hypothetical protein VSWAT3_19711 [Vibrionales bacterium SWAT-3]
MDMKMLIVIDEPDVQVRLQANCIVFIR